MHSRISPHKAKPVPDQDKIEVVAQPVGKLTASQQAWLDENREAIEEYNRWVDANEDPFAEFRRP